MKVTNLLLMLAVTLTLPSLACGYADHLKRSLEKEVLKHSLHYLRKKLLRCLHEAGASRAKRKVDPRPQLQLIEHDLDMDVLLHTQHYLMERLITCRQVIDDTGNDVISEHRKFPWFAPPSVLEKPPETDVTTEETTTTTTIPTPTVSPTFQIFEIDGRNVSCSSVEMLKERTIFRCRNLWVDSGMRLPNMHLCPPVYDPDAWTSMATVHARTKSVLDVENLCYAFSYDGSHQTHITNVRVTWGCDESNKERLKWLNDRWSGTVLDNGYLRDLECTLHGSFPTQ